MAYISQGREYPEHGETFWFCTLCRVSFIGWTPEHFQQHERQNPYRHARRVSADATSKEEQPS
jgi:hypothetical protein